MGITSGVFGFFYALKTNQRNSTLNALFHNQEMLRLITDNLPARITYIDRDLRFRFVNKTVENAYMMSKKDIYGKKVIDIIGEDVFNMAKKYFDKAFSGETVQYETSRPNKEGQIEYFTSILVPHYDAEEKIIGFFNLVTDITDIRMREEKIKKHEEELVKLNATKDKFFSIIAHDLKGPFNAMLNFSEILTDDIETLSREEIKQLNQESKNDYKH